MNTISKTFSGFAVFTLITLSVTQAQAFCGVIQKSATASSAAKASWRAQRDVRREVRPLMRQYGHKLQLDQQSVACVGGAVAVDADGNQIYGKPSCTVTQSFCVNP